MNKAASEGRVENLSNMEIVPYMPHPDTKTHNETRLGSDGTQEEFQKEWRNAPTQAHDWMQQMRSKLRCTPSHGNLLFTTVG
jgi:hypothetical protein